MSAAGPIVLLASWDEEIGLLVLGPPVDRRRPVWEVSTFRTEALAERLGLCADLYGPTGGAWGCGTESDHALVLARSGASALGTIQGAHGGLLAALPRLIRMPDLPDLHPQHAPAVRRVWLLAWAWTLTPRWEHPGKVRRTPTAPLQPAEHPP